MTNMGAKFALAFAVAVSLVGCAGNPVETASPTPSVAAATPPAYSVDRIEGSWGVASYRDEKDKVRVEAQARAQCKNPLVITKGPTDGVMTYVADDTALHELTFKGGPDGKTYLGFAGPPGDDQDREILSLNDKMFVARYVSPETNSRYGTLIYVRCKTAAR